MKVLVVGAGLGGLAAAARLAHAGHQVTVCEQASEVGGKLGRHTAQVAGVGTFRWDTGPSLVTMPQVLTELFEATGGLGASEGHDDAAPLLTPLDPIARYRFADGAAFDASPDEAAFAAELDRVLGTGNGAEWTRFMARAGRAWAATEGPFLRSRLDGAASMARLAVSRPSDIAAVAPGRTLRQVGTRYLTDPRLRMFLDRYATYTGSDPRRAPAALMTVPYAERHFGGWYVPGGLYRIAEQVAARARACGAVVRTGADVVALTVSGGQAVGATLADGEHLAADLVVANADASHLYGDLVAVPAASRRLARATPSLSGFVVLLGVRGRTDSIAHHTVWFPADYDAEFDAVFAGRPVTDPTIYAAVPDDPAVTPEGYENWFLLVNAPRQGQFDWRADGVADGYADRLLELLAERGTDLTGRVVHRAVLSPADLERRTRAVGGSIYGTSSNGARAAFLRPANISPLPGLRLVGGSSHPGGGLPLVLLSADLATRDLT